MSKPAAPANGARQRLGVLGGGQLGRMLGLAGIAMGLEFHFYDPAADICAAAVGPHTKASYDDAEALAAFCQDVQAVTYEFENVPVEAARSVARQSVLAPGGIGAGSQPGPPDRENPVPQPGDSYPSFHGRGFAE